MFGFQAYGWDDSYEYLKCETDDIEKLMEVHGLYSYGLYSLAFILIACVVLACIDMAYSVMASRVMAHIVMAHIVMAHIVMARIVMAYGWDDCYEYLKCETDDVGELMQAHCGHAACCMCAACGLHCMLSTI